MDSDGFSLFLVGEDNWNGVRMKDRILGSKYISPT